MKKVLFLLVMIGGMGVKSYGQMGEWTWMNGDSTENSLGHYGIQGVFDSLNAPPALYEACEWTDLNGNFWLFGGVDHLSKVYGDLWEFNPLINEWAWIRGPGISNQYGIYGTQGISSPNNNPGCRGYGIMSWVDSSNNLWFFGGYGYSANQNGCLGDLWEYSINTDEWTWMKGSDSISYIGNYGTIGIENSLNNPRSRDENNGTWTDGFNNLWLFGGRPFSGGNLNDLWKFNIANNCWTWINGSDSSNYPSSYGIKGIPDTNNNPGAKYVYSTWKGQNNDLWMFGGDFKNDLWRYNIASNIWTWMSGTNYSDTFGNYGANCISSVNFISRCKYENRAHWTLNCDNFINFGGMTINYVMNDLWNYNVYSNEWTLINGNSLLSQHGSYGIKYVSNSTNIPSSRLGSIGWKDLNGNLWMFGGQNYTGYRCNDMWRFVPDTTCPYLCNQTTEIKETPNNKSEISLYPNPTSGIFTLTYNSQFSILNSQLEIYDVLGQEVYHQAIINQESTIINLPQLSNGVYFYQLSNSKETYRGKFVKEN